MRVTKLKRGYRIRLSDTEFEALRELVGFGLADIQVSDPGEFSIPKRVANAMDGFFLGVDEDRRQS